MRRYPVSDAAVKSRGIHMELWKSPIFWLYQSRFWRARGTSNKIGAPVRPFRVTNAFLADPLQRLLRWFFSFCDAFLTGLYPFKDFQ